MSVGNLPQTAASWRREHEYFVVLLDFLERHSPLAQSGARQQFDLMLDALGHINFFSERYHRAREEAVFACLAAQHPPSTKLLKRLIKQHRILSAKGRKVYVLMGESSGLASREAVSHLLKYLRYFRRHIAVEEEQILPLAVKTLSESDWRRAEAAAPAGPEPFSKFSAHRHQPGFGDEAEESYHSLRDRIARISQEPRRGVLERRKAAKPGHATPPAEATQPPMPQVRKPERFHARQAASRAVTMGLFYMNRYRQAGLLLVLVLSYLQFYFLDVNLQILRLPEIVFYFFTWAPEAPAAS